MESFSELNDQELIKKLEALKEDLADIENEKNFTSNQSGLHLSSAKIISQIKEFDSEISILNKQLSECCNEVEKRNLPKV
ncbi:hypothetical protein GH810_02500 [Acetobacterium paludosum]|uniref:Uncharacterized protein n=1 Tax=Acetobacterium paludosum TaxID=52693 RepID=A0A923KVN2_9FIRM|nr:hypothetical protein [Acetobacterium paludosum]MBC3887178.1 hypothetical protein [Acetobacterium paludosum]